MLRPTPSIVVYGQHVVLITWIATRKLVIITVNLHVEARCTGQYMLGNTTDQCPVSSLVSEVASNSREVFTECDPPGLNHPLGGISLPVNKTTY